MKNSSGYEIRVTSAGMSCERALVELVTEDGSLVLNPRIVKYEADAEGGIMVSLTFYGHQCRIAHTPAVDAKPAPTSMPPGDGSP
jgi:hypothetical protein